MIRKLNILLIEDEPLDVELIRSSLKKADIPHNLEWVNNATDLKKKLAVGKTDLLISDYSVPAYDVREEITWISRNYPDLPLIIVTGTIDEGTAATCLHNGAWDYVLKTNLTRIGPAISQALNRQDEIRNRRGLEEQFRRKAEEHLLLLDHIDLMVWFQPSGNKLGVVNRAFADFWGRTKEELEGSGLDSLVKREEVGQLQNLIEEALESGRNREGEIYLSGKSTGQRLFRLKCTPVQSLAPDPAYIICSAEDITCSRQQQEAIRQSEERYRRIFENTGTATVSFFSDRIIRMFNHYAEELTGYSREEMIDKKEWTILVHPDDLPRMLEYHERRTQGKEAPSEYEFRLVQRNGSVRHLFMKIAVDRDTRERIVSLTDITRIKEYQKQLLNQEAELKALLEYSPIAHIYEDFSGSRAMLDELSEKGISDFTAYFEKYPEEYLVCRRKIRVAGLNKAFLNLFGLKDADELESRYLEIVTPESIRMFVEGLVLLYRGESYFEKMTQYQKPDGSIIHAKTQWLTIPGHEKELDLVAVTIHDMTAQLQASEKEKEYQKHLRYLSENALTVLDIGSEEELYHHTATSLHALAQPCIVLVSSYDPANNLLVLKSFSGLEEPEILLDIMKKQNTDKIALEVAEPYTSDMKTGRLIELKEGLKDLSFGLLKTEEAARLKDKLKAGKVYGMGFVWGGELYGCATLIMQKEKPVVSPEILETLIKQSSIALQRLITQRLTNTLSEAVAHSPVSVIITNPLGKIEYVNPRFCQVTGYSLEEVIGKSPSILKSGQHSREFYADLWNTIRTVGEWRGEFLNRKKNGEFLWELASISAVKNPKGEISHFVSVKEDITDRKMMEEELRRAKEKAEESDQLKTAFLANLSHEIRTPMNAISGFSELIGNFDLENDARREYTSIIKSNVALLSALIDDIIDFSKLESGIMPIEQVPVDLNKIFSELETFYRHEIGKLNRQVELRVHKPDGLNEEFRSDALRIRQILSNLIGNAIKFTEEGFIEVGCMPDDNGMMTFFVRDTGIGIAEDKFNLIFERFRQADGSTTRKYGGTGLGLAICRGLVEVMGGKIWLESAPGTGSTFYFSLPHGPEDKTSATQESDRISQGPDWEGHTLLVAEDNESNFLVLKAGLKHTRATILWVKTGRDAIELCRDNEEISLVLMDVQMPDIDGLEATRQIKILHPGMPVIAQTAFSMPEDIDRIVAAGCDDFITKPIQFRLLIRKMEKYIDRLQ